MSNFAVWLVDAVGLGGYQQMANDSKFIAVHPTVDKQLAWNV